jgi:hypothetical protein
VRRVPRPIPTLFIVLRDGTINTVRMRSLRIAREAAFGLNQVAEGGAYRAVFAMWR